MKKILIPCFAMACIATIEIFAIRAGLDGAMMSASFAAIGGIAGFMIHKHSWTK